MLIVDFPINVSPIFDVLSYKRLCMIVYSKISRNKCHFSLVLVSFQCSIGLTSSFSFFLRECCVPPAGGSSRNGKFISLGVTLVTVTVFFTLGLGLGLTLEIFTISSPCSSTSCRVLHFLVACVLPPEYFHPLVMRCKLLFDTLN